MTLMELFSRFLAWTHENESFRILLFINFVYFSLGWCKQAHLGQVFDGADNHRVWHGAIQPLSNCSSCPLSFNEVIRWIKMGKIIKSVFLKQKRNSYDTWPYFLLSWFFFSTTFVQKNVLKIDFLGGKTVYWKILWFLLIILTDWYIRTLQFLFRRGFITFNEEVM